MWVEDDKREPIGQFVSTLRCRTVLSFGWPDGVLLRGLELLMTIKKGYLQYMY